MAYCTNQDVIDLTGTGLSTSIIDSLITKSDRKVARVLTRQGLGTSFSSVPDDVGDASAGFAASMVLRRHMVDGTLPESYAIGDVSGKINVIKAIQMHEAEANEALNLYIKDQVGDFRIYRVVGHEGERVGEYHTMGTEEEDET